MHFYFLSCTHPHASPTYNLNGNTQASMQGAQVPYHLKKLYTCYSVTLELTFCAKRGMFFRRIKHLLCCVQPRALRTSASPVIARPRRQNAQIRSNGQRRMLCKPSRHASLVILKNNGANVQLFPYPHLTWSSFRAH